MRKVNNIISVAFISICFFNLECREEVDATELLLLRTNDIFKEFVCSSLDPFIDTSLQIIALDNKWQNGSTLRVKFLDGEPKSQDDVMGIIKQWEEHANIKFRLVRSGQSDIRISFNNCKGNWSYIGKNNLNYGQSEITMCLSSVPFLFNKLKIQRVILHEFGHAIGAIHEHQQPNSKIPWNKVAVYEYYRDFGWSDKMIQDNIFNKGLSTNNSEYDPFSIMHYPIPESLLLDPKFATSDNYQLSNIDKCFINKVYPFNVNTPNWLFGSGYGILWGGWYVGDFNGDGKDDILRNKTQSGGAEVVLSSGTNFSLIKTWAGHGNFGNGFGEGFNGSILVPKNENIGWYLGDFNGDGKDDIMRVANKNGGAEVALSNGLNFGKINKWSGYGNYGKGWYIGDFNGDGKDDILRNLNEFGGAEVALSTGSSFGTIMKWSGYGNYSKRWYIGDFNGDGKDDIMRLIKGTVGAEVALSNGKSFSSIVPWTSYSNGGYGWYVGDFNGDGKDDIMRNETIEGGASVLISQGNSFKSPVKWTGSGNFRKGWFLGDFNGDGKIDILRYININGGAEVFLSTGLKFKSTKEC